MNSIENLKTRHDSHFGAGKSRLFFLEDCPMQESQRLITKLQILALLLLSNAQIGLILLSREATPLFWYGKRPGHRLPPRYENRDGESRALRYRNEIADCLFGEKSSKLRFPWCSGDHSVTNCGVAENDSVVEENHTDSSEIGADRGYARICPDKAASVERSVKAVLTSHEVLYWEGFAR